MAYVSIDVCPLSSDAAAYRLLLQDSPGRYCVPLSKHMPEQLATYLKYVPLSMADAISFFR